MNNYHYQWLNTYQPKRPTLVCLHGFTGCLDTFELLKDCFDFNILGIDLPGHGQTKTHQPTDYAFLNVLDNLHQILQELDLKNFHLLGYSMGGRVALGFNLRYPSLVKSLILESSTAGLDAYEKRFLRQCSDAKLAANLWNNELEEFVDFWQDITLFASQKKNLSDLQRQLLRTQRLKQDKFSLALSLKYMGTGSQPNYWPYIKNLTCPLLYVAGQEDFKFCGIGQKICAYVLNADMQICPKVGHCVHLEAPKWFTDTVLLWLKEQEKKDENCGS